jgi:ABC-2 type transport system permease protein
MIGGFIRAEFRKLLTVRSTYALTAVLLLLLGFISFWAVGYKNHDFSTHVLDEGLQTIAPLTGIVSALIAILLMSHEYRYNTITYTLSLSNSRSKVLLAKIITVFVYTLIATLVVVALTFALVIWGNKLGGHPLPPQNINLVTFLARAIFYCEGLALAILMITTLIRNLVFSIVFLFIVPNTIETLLTLVFKEKAIYLPFSALGQVIASATPSADTGPFKVGHLSPLKGAVVFTIYLVIGWMISWYLFLRRDAA